MATQSFKARENGNEYQNEKEEGNNCPRSPGSDMFRSTNNIKVYVRIRPLSKDEYARGETSCVHIARDEHSVKVVEQGYGYNTTTRSFQFDGCVGPAAEQHEVMETVEMKKLLDKVLEGYSSTVMACGQTGSGKTFTMSGREEGMHDKKGYEDCWGDDGLIARSAIYLFEAIKARSFNKDQTKPYTLRASYFEIYCEQVNDLLRLDAAPRDVKWSSRDGFYVENLLLVDCDTLEDVFSVLNEGGKNRKVGSHELNKDSSRSHCIMTLHVDTLCDITGDGHPIVRYGRMLFVDLAGSERLKKSKSSGEMLKETGSINRSLFTLGKVISALSEGKKGDVVPYRESMLTKLLMESLGGNSLALMIACVSSAASAVDETLSTLHYATCAKNIVNAPSINMDARDKIMMKLQKEIAHLREENKMLRTKLGLSLDGDLTYPEAIQSVSPMATKHRRQTRNMPPVGLEIKCPTELKGLEKYFGKEFGEEASGLSTLANFQDVLPQQSARGSLTLESLRCMPSQGSFGSSQQGPTLQAYSEDDAWGDNCEKTTDGTSTPCVLSEPRTIRASCEPNSFLGMYRGSVNVKPKGVQQFSRRNRVSVDHLGGSRARLKKGYPRRIGKQDAFQGSITVNQAAFIKKLLDLNISPVDGMVNF
ncbi:unnamed protein product [Sphagnum compactum]